MWKHLVDKSEENVHIIPSNQKGWSNLNKHSLQAWLAEKQLNINPLGCMQQQTKLVFQSYQQRRGILGYCLTQADSI